MLRSLRTNKGYTFLNVFGLAIGIACAALIFLWVEDEVHFDAHNVNKDQLYLVNVSNVYDTYTSVQSSTPGPLGPALQSDLPGIENSCRVTDPMQKTLISVGDKSVYASGCYAEPSLFRMFTLPFVEGNAQSAFSQLHSLVITESTARKVFGTTEGIVGRTIQLDLKDNYTIGGVIRDIPVNSTLRFDWVAPYDAIYQQQKVFLDKWYIFTLNTYLELRRDANPVLVNRLLYNYLGRRSGDTTYKTHLLLFGMNDWRLRNQFENGKLTGGGRITYVRLFSAIAWIILLIACINFMNLATARSDRRAREVGVKKVLGAGRKRLALQFFGESLLLSLLATVGSVVLIILSLPTFNTLVQKSLSAGWANPLHIGALCAITLVCGVVAGSYPSFYLSSFNPIFALKGIKLKTGGAAIIRKGLVVVQFTVAIVLIIGTLVVYRQIQHVKSRHLGFNKDNLVQVDETGTMNLDFDAIHQDLVQTGVVENAALADHEVLTAGNNSSGIDWDGKDPNSNQVFSERIVSPEYMQTQGMHILEGRDFLSTDTVPMQGVRGFFPKDLKAPIRVLITRTMERAIGNGSALGKILRMPSNIQAGLVFNLEVVGVVDDYLYGDMYGKPDPVIFFAIPRFTNLMFIRLKPTADIEGSLAKIGASIRKDNPAYPWEYQFVDEQFNTLFLSENLIGKLSRVFATLAILISCLGLFGLAAYTAERRTKEIGIRKVLGASAASLAGLLSRDFLRLVWLSCLIAFPVAEFLMDHWLRGYAYRINLGWTVFAFAGLGATVIALATISFQSLRTALANPTKSLRSE